jgi:hypothetical protein
MVLPVSGANVADAYSSLRSMATTLAGYCNQTVASVNGGGVNANFVLGLLQNAINTLSYAKTIQSNATLKTAIVSYVQQQVGNSTLDVSTDFDNSVTALSALVTAVIADYPKDANGHLLDRTFDANGNIIFITLTAAMLPQTMPAITAWLATIA